jgi:phosphoribosylglycinamide formyltransferase-1
MYGDRVFEAVLSAGEGETGISIHLVDDGVDSGPVMAQCKVPVLPSDSIETLKARVRARERDFVVETIAHIAMGSITLHPAV